MDTRGSETRENYQAMGDQILAARRSLLVSHPELEGFWNRWLGEHRLIIETFVAKRSEADRWESLSKELLQRRERLVSTLAQGLKRNPATDAATRTSLREMLREHDQQFARMLAAILEQLKNEFVKTNTARKAIGAYAKAASNLGDY